MCEASTLLFRRREPCRATSDLALGPEVTSPESVASLGKFAKEQLGTVHYWVNNAGINGGRRPMLSLSPETLAAVVNVRAASHELRLCQQKVI